MRIGIDARPLTKQRTGIGTYVVNVIKYLNAHDETNEFYLFSCKEVVLDFELKSNFHIIEEDYAIGTVWLALRTNRLIKQYNIDVFWGTQHVLPITKNPGTKYILTIFDLAQFRINNIGSRYNSVIQKVFVKGSCKRADKILAISEATKYDIVDLLGIESRKIAVTYLGGNEKVVLPDSMDINIVKEKFTIKKDYFLFVSTIEPRKNIETLIDAFNTFIENTSKDYELVIAGGLGWKYENILAKIENSPYKDRIIRTGFVTAKEKQCLYAGATAFVYPSLYEGFGIPILEAMNYRLPIITTNVSSLPEVGQDAVMYLENVHDKDALAGLLDKCSELTSEEIDRIKQLDMKVSGKFSWDKCAKETVAHIIKM